MATPEDPKATTILFIGIVGSVAVFLIVVLLQIVFYRMQEMETVRKDIALGAEELATLDAGQLATLNSYGWVNEAEGVARIPVERAMELTAAELAAEARAERVVETVDLATLLSREGGIARIDPGEPIRDLLPADLTGAGFDLGGIREFDPSRLGQVPAADEDGADATDDEEAPPEGS